MSTDVDHHACHHAAARMHRDFSLHFAAVSWCRLALRNAVMTPTGDVCPNLIKKALHDAWPGYSDVPGKGTVVVDLFHVPEPQCALFRGHTGLHPRLFRDFVRDGYLDKPLQHVYDNICGPSRAWVNQFVILCVDRRGLWASQTLAKIMAEVSMTWLHPSLNGVTILTPVLDWSCAPCDACKFWDRRWIDKNQAVRLALQKWHRLMSGHRLCQ